MKQVPDKPDGGDSQPSQVDAGPGDPGWQVGIDLNELCVVGEVKETGRHIQQQETFQHEAPARSIGNLTHESVVGDMTTPTFGERAGRSPLRSQMF